MTTQETTNMYMDLLIYQAHIMSKETKTTMFGLPPLIGWEQTETKVMNPHFLPLFVGTALTAAAARIGYLPIALLYINYKTLYHKKLTLKRQKKMRTLIVIAH